MEATKKEGKGSLEGSASEDSGSVLGHAQGCETCSEL